MRILEKITIILFAAVLLTFGITRAYLHFFVDRTAPVISCSSEVLEAQVNASSDILLQGVTASDNMDGDLTDQILVKGITPLITDNTAKITYVVFDSSDNMGTCTRTIRYTNYEKPHFSLHEPLIFPVGSHVPVLDRLTAQDTIDGDISGSIRIIAQNISSSYEGVYNITAQVTNRLGDVETLPLKVIISSASAAKPLITLTDYIVYLDRGSDFDPYDYIEAVTDRSGQPVNGRSVQVDSAADTAVPGVYDVSYLYQTYTVYLTVVVK